MSTALDWLRQQRRPITPLSAPCTRDPAPSDEGWQDVFTTLRRLRERGPRRVAPPPRPDADRTLPGEEIAPGLWRHVQHRPWPIAPETLDLSMVPPPSRRRAPMGRPPLPPGPIDARRLLFFDTETTGLAGGTGTRAFMLGLARFDGRVLAITQFTTATMGAEPALLDALCDALAADTVLVSYNGRSYDRPLLSTRLRLARRVDPLPGLPHLDLLHPTRRRLRDRLPDCRLATVERHWLGIAREHDLPGSEAPAAWLSFLKGGSAALLRRVGEHNAQDLAGLATLLLKHLEADAEWEAAPA
jgi:hypothetical protein